jgi:signal peptidase I
VSTVGTKGAKKRSKSAFASVVELVLIVAVALGLALAIQAWIVKPYRIPSSSMEPTLKVGQRVLVNRIGNDFGNPSVGDIVVFHPPKKAGDQTCGPSERRLNGGAGAAACDETEPEQSSTNFIKRIVAGPGDVITIREGHVIRNGVSEKDSYINPCPPATPACNFPTPIRIPAGHYFMMGDNRGESDDSRFWGPVPKSWIIGAAFATYWPPDRIGLF